MVRALLFGLYALAGWFLILRLQQGLTSSTAKPSTRSGAGGNGAADPYTVLGVERGCTRDALKRAYREALALYHPDKVNQLGPKLRRTAERETQRINAAYAAILEERGWNK